MNAHISPEDCSLQYIKVDNVIAILQDLGQNCFMSKLDIKAAFWNIPVHPSDWELLGMKWQGLYFFDMVLPLGLGSTPFVFDQFSSALEWIIQYKLYIPKVIHNLDHFFIAASPPRSQCATALCHVLHLFTELDIPIVPRQNLSSLYLPGIHGYPPRLPYDGGPPPTRQAHSHQTGPPSVVR